MAEQATPSCALCHWVMDHKNQHEAVKAYMKHFDDTFSQIRQQNLKEEFSARVRSAIKRRLGQSNRQRGNSANANYSIKIDCSLVDFCSLFGRVPQLRLNETYCSYSFKISLLGPEIKQILTPLLGNDWHTCEKFTKEGKFRYVLTTYASAQTNYWFHISFVDKDTPIVDRNLDGSQTVHWYKKSEMVVKWRSDLSYR